jgi:hypothetical protein
MKAISPRRALNVTANAVNHAHPAPQIKRVLHLIGGLLIGANDMASRTNPMTDARDRIEAARSYFSPLPDPAAEQLAAHLYRRHREHEAIIAEWTDPTFPPWESVEPDIQRSYRAIAVAAAGAMTDAERDLAG